jgi:hypothetical protein
MKKVTFLIFFGGICLLYLHAQNKPAWVDKPSAVYPDQMYVSAVGLGRDRRSAESGALGSLTAYFKQSVSSSVTINDSEREVNGRSTTESRMSQSIEASSALDTLIGAEIKNTWNDAGTQNWYAVAVMEKAKCRGLYAAALDKTISEINTLIDTSGGIVFETISKCKKAQDILGKADVYALLLSMLDGPDRQPELSQLAAKTATTLDWAKVIPVDVRVSGDVNGRIKAAFSRAFTEAGFRTGNRNSRFALEVRMTLAPVNLDKYFNTRYTVDAVLKDTRTGTELFTYNIVNREAHPTDRAEANNRAVIGAERKITEEFPGVLREYLESN